MARHKNSNGEGYCRRIDKNKWECTIMSKYINPKTMKEKRIKRVGESEADARRKAKLALKAWEKQFLLSHDDTKVSKTKTFGQYMQDYLKSLEGTITDSCYRSYCTAMNRYFFSYPIHNLQLHMLNKLEFQSFYDDIASHYSIKTCTLPVQLCRRLCKKLIDRSLLEENFAEQAEIKLEKADEYYDNLKNINKKEIFTIEDIEKFLEAFRQHRGQYAVVSVFLLETGMRTSEFAALRNSDIDFEKMIITINKTRGLRYKNNNTQEGVEEYVKVPKNGKTRIVPISPLCLECIEEMQQQTNILCKNNYMDLLYPCFRNGKMRSNSTMEVGFKTLCQSIGIDRGVVRQDNGTYKGLCLHSLRHTAISYMKNANQSESTIASIMGHSEKVDNDIYTHKNVEMLKNTKTTYQLLNEEKQTIEMSQEEKELFDKFKKFFESQIIDD